MNGKWGIERVKREEAVSGALFNDSLFQPLVSGAEVIWSWNQGVC